MDKQTLLERIQGSLQQISELRKERDAIGSRSVKAWKTEVEQLLRLGGKNTSKLLQNFQNLRFGASAMGVQSQSSEVKFQAFQAEMDTAEKILKNSIQTIQIFGISEEQKLPDWFKQEVKASGLIKIGGREVDIRTVTIQEFLKAIEALAEADKSLDESLKKVVVEQLRKLREHPLLSPFLNQTLDKPFPHL